MTEITPLQLIALCLTLMAVILLCSMIYFVLKAFAKDEAEHWKSNAFAASMLFIFLFLILLSIGIVLS